MSDITGDSLCAHCDEAEGGAEGTIWCAKCLEWWRESFRVYFEVAEEIGEEAK